ncbi:MAB_1171c family putative transporter [Streptomyces sp. 8N706]|uniref:MAB_1171c family putative transporter n=1 Tax=Streptomyces sp. 8N706 TaxID=3457416 RepID=UPI003FD64B74
MLLFNLVYGVLAVITWSAFLYKSRDLLRDWHNRELRLLCLAISTFATPFVFAAPAVYVRVDRLLGTPNIATLITYSSVAVCITSFLALLVSWSSAQHRIRLRHRMLMAYAVATIATLITFFCLGDVSDAEHPVDFDVHYAETPFITPFLLAHQLLFTVGMVGLIRMCWRYSRAVHRPWLRRGLRVVTVGAVFGLGYCLPKVVSLLWDLLGTSPLDFVNSVVAPMSASVSAVLFAVGFTMPAWGAGLDNARDWVTQYRSYRRLHPLWAAVGRVFPEIVLYPDSSRRAFRDLKFLVGRQIIEIRDGQLALRPYYDPSVARTARELGEAKGITGDELEAVVEAARLAAALHARTSGAGTTAHAAEAPHDPAAGDIREEALWLIRVADAYRRCPVVKATLDRVQAARSATAGAL